MPEIVRVIVPETKPGSKQIAVSTAKGAATGFYVVVVEVQSNANSVQLEVPAGHGNPTNKLNVNFMDAGKMSRYAVFVVEDVPALAKTSVTARNKFDPMNDHQTVADLTANLHPKHSRPVKQRQVPTGGPPPQEDEELDITFPVSNDVVGQSFTAYGQYTNPTTVNAYMSLAGDTYGMPVTPGPKWSVFFPKMAVATGYTIQAEAGVSQDKRNPVEVQ